MHEQHVGHIVPVRVLLAVWAALVVLTGVTVGVAYIDLGGLNVWLALLVATVKASLVALYFMHLRYDKPINAVVLIIALACVMLFVSLSLVDTAQDLPIVEQWEQDNPSP
jgi:cytochrome c oxidase subunit 4